ncbi:MAG: Fic family protein [Bacteroidota bacterium]
MKKYNLIKSELFNTYKNKLNVNLFKRYNQLKKEELTLVNFDYYFSSSAVYSSNIEGNTTDFNSFWKYKKFNIPRKSKEIKEIDDLFNAYEYARKRKLALSNILKTHEILSRNFLIISLRGTFRNQPVGVYSGRRLEYLAIEPQYVKNEAERLFEDIERLLNRNLSIKEVFYYASMIHLVFVKIHPFIDGNGRVSRLLEKWFLASKLGENAWYIQSEQNYFSKRKTYYKNLNIGVNYYELNYGRCIPFLLMLPEALRT